MNEGTELIARFQRISEAFKQMVVGICRTRILRATKWKESCTSIISCTLIHGTDIAPK